MEAAKSSKGESAQKRQTRSIHEKQRRIEMNQVLTEMMELLNFDTKLQPKKPDKCWIIGKSVEFIRKNRISNNIPNPPDFYAEFLKFSGDFVIFELSDLMVVEKIHGDSKMIFGDLKMIGRDFRSFLDFDSGVNFERKNERIWNSIIGKRFSAFWENNKLLCFAEPSKLAEERPILAAMLSTPSPTSSSSLSQIKKSAAQTQNLDDTNTTITPSLHCDDSASSSSAFLSPQSSSSESKKKPRRGRKRLRSVNVIVETYSLDSTTPPKKGGRGSQNLESTTSISTSSTTSSITTSSLMNPSQIPALISPAPTPLNPYDVLTPGYRDIWLRLQSERLLLEQRVLAKERELQNLMMSTYSTPP